MKLTIVAELAEWPLTLTANIIPGLNVIKHFTNVIYEFKLEC
jgi:hypothetical protein